MRLNGRGLANIWEHEENKGLDIDCYEFQPSDFDEGVVVLSVEEAKILLECAYCVDAYTFTNCKKLFNCLEKRIEKAKTGNE